jgi:hypothetical protein
MSARHRLVHRPVRRTDRHPEVRALRRRQAPLQAPEQMMLARATRQTQPW